jgi:hypothetical protein
MAHFEQVIKFYVPKPAIHFGVVILSTDADPTGSDVAGFGEHRD